jgi:hypothetical protein
VSILSLADQDIDASYFVWVIASDLWKVLCHFVRMCIFGCLLSGRTHS